jgi:hypothetical protein
MRRVYEEKRTLSIPTCTIGADIIHAALMTSVSDKNLGDVVHQNLTYARFFSHHLSARPLLCASVKRHVAVLADLQDGKRKHGLDGSGMHPCAPTAQVTQHIPFNHGN